MKNRHPGLGHVRRGLSGKLLTLTSLFVMLAVVLVYVPSIANFYERWLADRIGRAHSVVLVLDAAPSGMVPESLARQLLDSVGARLIVLKTGDTRRLLASSDMPPAVSREVDLRQPQGFQAVRDAFAILFSGKGVIRVIGPAPMGGQFVEVLLDEAPLRAAMLAFSRNLLVLSLVVSAITGALVYLSLDRIIVLPMRRLAARMMAFGAAPQDPEAVIVPSGRHDEIGLAERELANMQIGLQDQLQSQNRLAALGLAVSKINHDLRNLLTAAQLGSERLANSADPSVRRLSAKLVTTLERAVAYCQSTLTYGAAQEAPPERREVDLAPLVAEMREALGVDDGARIGWSESIERGLKVDADFGPAVSRSAQSRPQRPPGSRRTQRSRPRARPDSRRRSPGGRDGRNRGFRHRARRAGKGARAPVRPIPGLDEGRRQRSRPRHRLRTGAGARRLHPPRGGNDRRDIPRHHPRPSY